MKQVIYVLLAVLIVGIMGMGCIDDRSEYSIPKLASKLDAIMLRQSAMESDISSMRNLLYASTQRNIEVNYQLMSSVDTIIKTLNSNKQKGITGINVYVIRENGSSLESFMSATDAIEFLKVLK